MLSRRHFIKGTARLAGLVGLSATGLLGTACSLSPASKYSYVSNRVTKTDITPVFYWTDVMLQTVRDQAVNPPRATRAFAMGHVAGFTAANAANPRYTDIMPLGMEAPKDIDPAIAYGTACSVALSEAFQSSFYFNRQAFLDQYPGSDKKSRSIQWGEEVGNKMKKMRAQDGAEPSRSGYYLNRYNRRDDALKWSPTGPFYGAENGPSFASFNRGLLPGWGAQKPWVMKSLSPFRAPAFPEPQSAEFARQYNKVRALGGKNYSHRTEDQTQIAFFWEDGPRGITPPGHWQLIAMDLMEHVETDFLQQARIFALMSLGQADAAITTWDSKFYHDIIRPETAIRLRAPEFNNPSSLVQQDSDWQSLIPTPPFPAYTSGHSTFSAVSAKILALTLGRDDIKFSGASPDLVNWPTQLRDVRRTWPSLTAAANEAGMSREYGGIHWEADDTEGLRIGRELGQYVFDNALRERV
jgi:hypothetical protein